jgi:hypothetical protein
MKSPYLFMSALAVCVLTGPRVFGDNAVLYWNDQALDATRLARNPPPVIALWFATYHAAIADAVDGIDRQWQPWLVQERAPANANIDAAIAGAAYSALVAIWGQQANPRNFEVAYEKALACIPDGPAKIEGIAWGRKVASAILAERAKSGFTTPVQYTPSDKPGQWRPTAPEFRSGVTPQMAHTKPFVLISPDQFRAPPPPPVGSKEYAEELTLISKIGARDNSGRTDYQTESVPFWSDALGTSGPAGHWNMIAENIARQRDLSTVACARLFALLNFAAADGFISCWDTKYYYNTARPETDIREIDKSINPYVEQKPDFIPTMPSLPFPSYTSAHMTFTTAATRVLALYFGTDDIAFTVTSDGLPGVVHSFKSFSAAAMEVGDSRVFGGIHTKLDVQEGRKAGLKIGDWVFAHVLLPLNQQPVGLRPSRLLGVLHP